jgi:hypothetical protein
MERSTSASGGLTTFVVAARAAIEKHVAESRTAAAAWHSGTGVVWVQWPREDGALVGLGLRRHLDWVTGEAALSRAGVDPESLPLWTGEGESVPQGYRVRLGVLLHDEDRWWPAGVSARELAERLEWLVIQLRVKATTHFAKNPLRD